MIDEFLDDLEDRIDDSVERDLFEQWRAFTDGERKEGIFSPHRSAKAPPSLSWPPVTVNEAIADFDKMALQQFSGCSGCLASANGSIMAIRCNYGTGIMPTLFGAELFMMEEAMNILPTSVPVPGGPDAMRALLEKGVPDPRAGLGGKALDMAARFQAILQARPKLGRHVHIYHPDLQGPMDVCELLWGSSLFIDIVDHPDLVKSVLDLITETYILFMREWEKIVPFKPENEIHWSFMHKGHIMLRDDSAMNFSPEMFAEFIAPFDQRLLDEFGGGALHFCGRGDHYIEQVGAMRGMRAVAMSQPEYNDMEIIYQNTVDKDIKLLGLNRKTAEEALDRGRDLKGNVHC
jgi:hypothetical protein